MNIFHGSPGSNITNASARAFATKGIIPEFRDCKWNYEEDPKGLPEFARNFKTVLEARFPEAVVLHSFIDHKAGRRLNIEMAGLKRGTPERTPSRGERLSSGPRTSARLAGWSFDLLIVN